MAHNLDSFSGWNSAVHRLQELLNLRVAIQEDIQEQLTAPKGERDLGELMNLRKEFHKVSNAIGQIEVDLLPYRQQLAAIEAEIKDGTSGEEE